jgi:toxin ParE1/3/4
MNVVWSPEAIDDLISLRAYIAEDDPAVARRMVLRILYDVEQLLSDRPNMGRAGRVPGTRELVISGTPYVVPYRVRHYTIEIIRVFHGMRRWPESI